MTKRKQREWKSIGELLRSLKAQIRKIELAKHLVPEEKTDDPIAMLAWLREQARKSRRRKKWE